MKKLVISTLFVMQVIFVFAQTATGVTGKVVDAKTQKPLQNVVASIQNTTFTQLTDATGKFTILEVGEGNQLLEVKTQGYKRQLLQIEVVAGKLLDLGVVVLDIDQTEERQLSLITITENDLGDDNSGSENTAGLLQATRDAFNQAAAFNFGQARFRVRGLDNEYGKTMINGIAMDKIYDGRPQWANWGGLNDATRNQEFTMGSAPSDYTFGGILGTQEINTRASIYRPGTRVSFSGTNTNYNYRMMATHASGMSTDGWAYVLSYGRRWAVEGYFDGTDYSANSIFASVEKKFNDKHSLNLTSIYAQNSRGKNSPNSKEINDIAGIEYNSYWGYLDGKKRNSRDKDVEEPIFILSHYWKLTEKTNLNTNLSFQTGSIGNSRLDFIGANNPDPTYYRNLPSYFSTRFEDGTYVGNSDYNVAGASTARFLTDRQLNWEQIYETNHVPVIVGGKIVGKTPGVSKTVLYEDRTDDTQYTANSILNSQLSDNIVLNAGGTYRKLRSENFQYLLDLLGGTHFEDTDQFFVGDQSQPNLLTPNRIVGKGDRYGYNYLLRADVIDLFTQFKFTYSKFDFYMAQTYSKSMYQREGLYQNGIYPTTSLGKSEKVSFENFGFKGGLTYKITGKHYLDFNALYMTGAPTMRNTFSNARLNNSIVQGLENEVIQSADASYVVRMPNFKARLTGYFSKIQNTTDIGFFYAEGVGIIDESGNPLADLTNAFVAEIVTGLDKKNIGAELGIEYQITSTIKATAAAAYGQSTYHNKPKVKLKVDYQKRAVDYGVSTMKNYKQAGMPQQAYSFGLEYRDLKYWWIGANANYLADNYLDISPLLRTNNFYKNPTDPQGLPFFDATEEKGRQYLKQEKFDPVTLVNLVGGKSWMVSRKNRNTIGFFASINNVFDVEYRSE